MEEEKQFKHLYNLYFNNECTAAELALFFNLLQKNKSDEEIIALLSNTWDNTRAIPDVDLIPEFLPAQVKEIYMAPEKSTSYKLRNLITVAAALFLILGSIYFFQSNILNIVNPVQQLQVSSIDGKRKQIKLSDGTKVWLSPNGKLNYPDKFEGSQRLISLDGEAFFEVAHDAKHPFIIKTGSVSTTVLGTSFNITAYQQQHTINVTLVTGKVSVALVTKNNTQRLMMLPNQQIIVDKETQQLSKIDFPGAASFLDKRLGLYEYNGAALQEVIDNIEAQYNIHVQLSEELSEKHFYGTLNMTDSLSQTLNKLCTVMETKWERSGGQYVILK